MKKTNGGDGEGEEAWKQRLERGRRRWWRRARPRGVVEVVAGEGASAQEPPNKSKKIKKIGAQNCSKEGLWGTDLQRRGATGKKTNGATGKERRRGSSGWGGGVGAGGGGRGRAVSEGGAAAKEGRRSELEDRD